LMFSFFVLLLIVERPFENALGKFPSIAFERYLKSGSGHAFARKRLW